MYLRGVEWHSMCAPGRQRPGWVACWAEGLVFCLCTAEAQSRWEVAGACIAIGALSQNSYTSMRKQGFYGEADLTWMSVKQVKLIRASRFYGGCG